DSCLTALDPCFFSVFLIAPAPPPPSPLSLHDALPISDALLGLVRRPVATVADCPLGATVQLASGIWVEIVAQSACVVAIAAQMRSEEHTSELQSLTNLVCRLLLEKKKRM